LRPGTENISLIAGMCEALNNAYKNINTNIEHVKKMENLFIKRLNESGIEYTVNGSPRITGLINITFNGVDGQSLLMHLDMCGIAISFGSACASGSTKASSILLETGMNEKIAKETVRISIGKFINEDHIETLINQLISIISRLKRKEEKVG